MLIDSGLYDNNEADLRFTCAGEPLTMQGYAYGIATNGAIDARI